MTWREVILALHGLRDRDRMMVAWIKRATFIIAASGMNGKEITRRQQQLWPDDETDASPKKDERALEQLRKFREAEALKRAKTKIDARK